MSIPLSLILNPIHWPSWLGVAFGWLLVQLPYRLQMSLGRGLGNLGYHLVRSRRHVAEVNIRLCFPELSEVERARLVRDAFRSAGMGVMETINAWWASDRRIASLAHFEGLEHLEKARASGKGVMILSAHFTSLEIGVRIMSMKATVSAMYKPVANPVFDLVQKRGREQKAHCAMIGHRDVRGFITALREGTLVWYSPDQYPNTNQRAIVPFFGQPAYTFTATGRLVRMSKAIVLPVHVTRRRGGSGYRLKIHPPLENFPTGVDEADALRINQLIEAAVRETPEQYFWVHRRFKVPRRIGRGPYV